MEKSVVEKTLSKRKPNLTYEELQTIASQNGIGSLYKDLFDGLFKSYFTRAETTRSSVAFKKGSKTILSLLPMNSSYDSGLKFQIYSSRFCERFNISLEQLNSLLPQNVDKWEYYVGATPEWSGYEGYFKSQEEILHFLSLSNSHSI